MQGTTKIYVLKEPDTGLVRYVGKTVESLDKRLLRHLSYRDDSYKNRWLKKLIRLNQKPIIEEVDCVPTCDWEFWEKHYIKLFKSLGAKLVNTTIGGEGTSGFKFTPEQLKKSIDSKIGKLRYRRRPNNVKSKISRSVKAKGVITNNTGGNNATEVGKYTLDGHLIETYPSVRKAEILHNYNWGDISRAIRKQEGITKGFKWIKHIQQIPKCPLCSSSNVIRYGHKNEVQKLKCKNCSYHFLNTYK